jgi:hypothetical protein
VSSIATFYLLKRPAIPGLVQAAKTEPIVIPAAHSPVIGYFRRMFGRWERTSPIVVSAEDNYLEEQDLAGYDDWFGYPLMHLMGLLRETGTVLGAAEYPAETEALNAADELTYLVTTADKRHLPALDPAHVDRAAAERYFGELSYDFEETQRVVDEGLSMLHRLIAALNEDEVLVITIA